jgi:hypothetical protein
MRAPSAPINLMKRLEIFCAICGIDLAWANPHDTSSTSPIVGFEAGRATLY